MLECVVNVSEGRRSEVIAALASAAGPDLLDVHSDPDHHRSVFTLVGEDAPRAVTRLGVELIDMRTHVGAHPRIGAVDVVPFVPLGSAPIAEAISARDRFVAWAVETLEVPCYLYGPERSLPEVRRLVRRSVVADAGPTRPHPSAGAIAVGARPVLVAYNIWLAEPHLAIAEELSIELRSPAVRTMAFAVGDHVQLSANLVSPLEFGPADLFDAVLARTRVARGELVGLLPRAVLMDVPARRWSQLDLDEASTIEARMATAGLVVDGEAS